MRGILKKTNNKYNCVVGDRVEISEDNSIVEIFKRDNMLIRPIVANVDYLAIQFAAKHPNIDFERINLLLLTAFYYKVKPIVIVNKIDYLTEEELYELKEKLSFLEKISVPMFLISCHQNIGLEEVGIQTDRGRVLVNEWYQTSVPGYYAIGDIIPTQALAHVASAEGITCVEKIKGLEVERIDYGNIPGCTYCIPEIASVGLTEKQAVEKGYEIKVGKFPFSASGKATANGDTDGFVKVIFDAKYGEWLGCHMIGTGVTEMISEAVVARKLETTGHEILKSVHPHPTLSEAVMEAVAAAYGEVIHI